MDSELVPTGKHDQRNGIAPIYSYGHPVVVVSHQLQSIENPEPTYPYHPYQVS